MLASDRKPGLRSFTLIELILGITLTSIILLSVSAVLTVTMSSRIKNQTIEDVDSSGAQAAMARITQTIRNAMDVTTPGTGAATSTLTLTVPTGGLSPTTFALSDGAITISEGGGTAVPLTSPRVIFSGLTFTNLSQTGTKGIIRIEFTVTGSSPSTRAEYAYSKTFYATAALR